MASWPDRRGIRQRESLVTYIQCSSVGCRIITHGKMASREGIAYVRDDMVVFDATE